MYEPKTSSKTKSKTKSNKTLKCILKNTDPKKFSKELYKYSSPTQAQKMAYKYLGKTAKLYPATKPEKKYRICDPNTNRWINFGQIPYSDFTRHKDKKRRYNYLTRTAKMRGNWKNNPYSANNLSRNILW